MLNTIKNLLRRRRNRPVFLDRDERNTVAIKQIKWLIAIVILFTTSIVLFVSGQIELNIAKSISSTDYNTSLDFSRSSASWSMGNIFTDKNKDMLVIQLNSNKSANTALPADGKDYKVFFGDKQSKVKEADVAFGRFGTDGSMYLFIPNPKKNYIYNIFIMNTKYLQQSIVDDPSGKLATISDDEQAKQSITAILSQTAAQGNVNVPTYNIEDNKEDLIGFRVTLTSSSKYTAANKTIVLDKPIVNDGKLDFGAFFNQIMQQRSVKGYKEQLENYEKQKPALEVSREEYAKRLKANPEDSDSKSALQNIENQIQTLNQNIEKTKKQIKNYENAKFKPEYFENVQTKATIITE